MLFIISSFLIQIVNNKRVRRKLGTSEAHSNSSTLVHFIHKLIELVLNILGFLLEVWVSHSNSISHIGVEDI